MIDKNDFAIPVTLHLTLLEAKALIALLYETAPDMVIYGKDRNEIGEWSGGQAAAEIKKALR